MLFQKTFQNESKVLCYLYRDQKVLKINIESVVPCSQLLPHLPRLISESNTKIEQVTHAPRRMYLLKFKNEKKIGPFKSILPEVL